MTKEQQEIQSETPRRQLVGFGQYFGRTEPTTIDELADHTIEGVALGESHVVAWTGEHVFARGRNYSGQLGLGHFDDQHKTRFERIERLTGEDVVSVQCGQFHTLLINFEGEVLAWGGNAHGQLCNGASGTDQPYPHIITTMKGHNIVDIACGASFTVFLTDEGKVFTCGDNSSGQLGLGNTNDQAVPKEVTQLRGKDVETVSCGGKHCVAKVRDSGDVYVWGSNKEGQLGQVIKGWLFVKEKVQVPTRVGWISDLDVVRVECGGLHTLILERQGQLHVFGDNRYGQLGLGKGTPAESKQVVQLQHKVVDMACFRFHNIANTESGELYAWGPNVSGQIGVDTGGCVAFAPMCVESLKGKKVLGFAYGHAMTATMLVMAGQE